MNSHRSISLMTEIKWKIHSIGMKMFVILIPRRLEVTEKSEPKTSFNEKEKRNIVSNWIAFHFSIEVEA